MCSTYVQRGRGTAVLSHPPSHALVLSRFCIQDWYVVCSEHDASRARVLRSCVGGNARYEGDEWKVCELRSAMSREPKTEQACSFKTNSNPDCKRPAVDKYNSLSRKHM